MKLNYSLKLNYVVLLVLVVALNALGILVVRSATNMNNDTVSRQIIGSIVGFVAALIISFIDYRFMFKFIKFIFLGIIAILAAVILIGAVRNNASRWIILPVIGQIQPAEFAKAGLILVFAEFFDRNQDYLSDIKTMLKSAILFGIPALLIFIEPNLSTTIILFVIFITMYIAAGLSPKVIAFFTGIVSSIVGLVIYLFSTDKYEKIPFLKDYMKKRILSFLNPAAFSDDYRQQQNSIMAIGSGGFFGKGLYNDDINSVKGANYLIEEETDFIFAVIGEELGFRGCLGILLLYFLLIVVILWIAGKANDVGGTCICVGVAAWIGFQTFTNIAVTTGLFPNTGVTLPFFSKGVSSLIALYLGIGLVLNVSLQIKQ
ncbi:MAG: FtsW/RodA/SpoVE family cell cycle protein [Eubacteriales bacterium]|nr:FtsW/RodA/SpoVE family cell cycle protein [Eubacteriales bacterium]